MRWFLHLQVQLFILTGATLYTCRRKSLNLSRQVCIKILGKHLSKAQKHLINGYQSSIFTVFNYSFTFIAVKARKQLKRISSKMEIKQINFFHSDFHPNKELIFKKDNLLQNVILIRH